jgi:biopolymer transport protein ExbD
MARKESTKLNPPPDASFPLSSMIDVVFLLLIFFLVTQKPVTEEVMINVELPAPDMSTVAADPLIPITIDVDKYSRDNIDEIDARLAALGDRDDPNEVLKDERLYYSFNGSAPMEVARLRERLAAVAAADANSTIIIKCDPNVKYRKLIRVLDLCSELGLNSRQLVDKVKPFIPDPPPQRGRR